MDTLHGSPLGPPGAAKILKEASEVVMEPKGNCQACRRVPTESMLRYHRGVDVVHHESLLQCDICERFACAECLKVYDIISGYDFLCHECAHELGAPGPPSGGH
jgi:hypothetical protein